MQKQYKNRLIHRLQFNNDSKLSVPLVVFPRNELDEQNLTNHSINKTAMITSSQYGDLNLNMFI